MAQNDRAMDNQIDRNPARNLTHDDRVRGGRNSAAQQTRDSHGQFAGRRSGESGRGGEMSRGDSMSRGGMAAGNVGEQRRGM